MAQISAIRWRPVFEPNIVFLPFRPAGFLFGGTMPFLIQAPCQLRVFRQKLTPDE
jgi:hypothetical protein